MLKDIALGFNFIREAEDKYKFKEYKEICNTFDCYNESFSYIYFNFYFYFILLYNTVLVLPYIDMNPPRVYMHSQA